MIIRPSAIGDDQGLDFLGIKDDYEPLVGVSTEDFVEQDEVIFNN